MPKAWKRAVELYKSGYATKILVTGEIGLNTIESGIEISEAEIINIFLIVQGIVANDIIIENMATNKLENVLFGVKEINT
ncbi:MAG: ElyC/SanA/YdcF family protein [Patescibacteria group bacterium]|jgi:uncharacterized SAM-binding protein YcdF (DUF218 family)